jgi:hypothetical protein
MMTYLDGETPPLDTDLSFYFYSSGDQQMDHDPNAYGSDMEGRILEGQGYFICDGTDGATKAIEIFRVIGK